MKRAGHLFEQIADTDNLLEAFHKAQKGKQNRAEVMAFRSELHPRIESIRSRLLSGTFLFGAYHQFYIRDPKERLIQAAPFEQRVVHHAIINVAGPVFERRFIFDSYACRKGKGQHTALARAERFVRNHPFYLKMDIRKFYDTINHATLSGILARQIKDRQALDLLDCVIGSYCTEAGKGLPIGNLTSQYFGNVYLSQFDHWIKEEQRLCCYLRYMDDMLCFGSHEEMVLLRDRGADWLAQNLKLELNHYGEINRTEKGAPFLGHVLYPVRIRLSQRSEHRFRTKFRTLERSARRGGCSMNELQSRAKSLFASAGYGQTEGIRRYVASTSYFRDM